MPGYIAGLKQGWAFSWRSLVAAELITYSPALGIAIDLLIFSPLERRVLRNRGLAVDRQR